MIINKLLPVNPFNAQSKAGALDDINKTTTKYWVNSIFAMSFRLSTCLAGYHCIMNKMGTLQ